MITALLDERPLAAGELARLAGVSPATASAHLARLLNGGLVTMIKQGRHRYYHLAGPEVAAPDVAVMAPPGWMVHVVAARAVVTPRAATRAAAQPASRIRA